LESIKLVMPGLVPGIHGVPLERQSLLNLGVFPHPASGEFAADREHEYLTKIGF